MGNSKYLFTDLIGNAVNIRLLRRSIAENTFKQFTILSGILGTGKSTCAKIAAMALTCKSSSDGQPCLKCEVCKANLAAFDSTGESMWIKMVNAGKIVNRRDVTELIHEMFELHGGMHNHVFIIEESHALNCVAGAETAFLTEIDQMPSNTFVIMCTTKMNEIIPELQSRALVYNFQRLTTAESALLLECEAGKRNISVPEKIKALILHNGRGIPRNIISVLEFASENCVSEEDLISFLQIVDEQALLQLFLSMRSDDMGLYTGMLDNLLASSSVQAVMDAVKGFVLKAVFLTEGGIYGDFSKADRITIQDIFCPEILQKIVALLDRSSYKISEADLKLVMYRIRLIIQHRNVSSVISDSRKTAAVENIHAKELQADLASQEVGKVALKRLNAEKLNSF